MNSADQNIFGLILWLLLVAVPLFLFKRARTEHRFAMWVSVSTFLVMAPLIYLGTALQAPAEASDNPIRYLVIGYAFLFGLVLVVHLAWRLVAMPYFIGKAENG